MTYCLAEVFLLLERDVFSGRLAAREGALPGDATDRVFDAYKHDRSFGVVLLSADQIAEILERETFHGYRHPQDQLAMIMASMRAMEASCSECNLAGTIRMLLWFVE